MYTVPYPASCDDNDELYDRLKKHGKRIKALEDVLDGMQTQINNGQSSQSLVLMAKQIQDFGGVLTGVDRRLTELDQRLIADTTGLRQGLEAQKNNFASLDQRIFKDISGLTQGFDDQKAGLASLDQRVVANISGLTQGLDGQKADLASLDQRVERVAANINGLTQGLDGQKADLGSLDQRVERVVANINGLKQGLNGQKADLVLLDKRVERVVERINGVEQGLNGQKADFASLDQRIERMVERINGVEQGLDGQRAGLASLDQRVVTLEHGLNEQTLEISDLRQVIGSIGALDQRVLSDVDGLKNKIAPLDSDIKGLKRNLEDIGALDQRVNSLQQGIRRVDDLDQRINSLETGVRKNAEARLIEYKTELDHRLDEMSNRLAPLDDVISEKVINASANTNDRISALEQALAKHAGTTGGTLQNLEARYGKLIQKATETEDMLSRYTERVGTSMDGVRAETEQRQNGSTQR